MSFVKCQSAFLQCFDDVGRVAQMTERASGLKISCISTVSKGSTEDLWYYA